MILSNFNVQAFYKITMRIDLKNKINLNFLTSNTEAHKENLRVNLKRRIEAARSKGDFQLVQQLQEEADYLKI